MAVQTTSGAVRVDPDDLQFTHRGIHVAIKCRVVPELDLNIIQGFVNRGQGWDGGSEIWQFGDFDGPLVVAQDSQWLATKFVPRANEWLATVFPKAGQPGATGGSAMDRIHEQVSSLRFVVRSDGTLVLELPKS